MILNFANKVKVVIINEIGYLQFQRLKPGERSIISKKWGNIEANYNIISAKFTRKENS